MSAYAPVPKDHPLMLAWEKHKATDDYANSHRWAGHLAHRDGSLWALFLAGWSAAIESQAAQIAALKTVMIAAAEEIHAHWDAHCDAEGYGPANLQRRLEEGVPAEYGYTAGRFAELIAERDAAKAELARLRAERVPDMDAWVLQALVAAGHVTQAKVDEAFSIAATMPPPPAQPAPTRSQQLADAGYTRRPSLWAMQAREALELIAAPMRPDGTWNRDRGACQQLAAEALGRYADDETKPAPPSADARDAARYRELRAEHAQELCAKLYGQEVPCDLPADWPRELDEWVDASIDAAAGKGEALC